jgi:ATP-dependent DNA helicase RecG
MLPTVTTLTEPLVEAIGPIVGGKLGRAFGMLTVGDLLRHYPRRYYTRGERTNLADLREGEHATVLTLVEKVKRQQLGPPPLARRSPKQQNRPREKLEVIVTDGTARLTVTFFARVGYTARVLQPGMIALFAGTVSVFRGQRQLVHPEFDVLPQGMAGRGDLVEDAVTEYATQLVPVYPANAKVSTWVISRCTGDVLETLEIEEDPLPAEVQRKYGLWPLAVALRAIHRPQDRADVERAKKRLRWDEAFVMQTALAQRRKATAAMPAVPRPRVTDGIAVEFDRRLPFTLTDGQRRVGETIAKDLACAYPMNRLLQGEVGSGKTVVAVRAMLQVTDAGGQAVLLAPTEVLAQQHYRSIRQLLGPLAEGGTLGAPEHATQVALLTGSTGVRDRRRILTDVFTGDAGILIGTHALLEDQVQFADLGLVVVDEQHRFGVEQRDALRDRAAGARPHVLVMTATPIPRTVAMTVFGDLETSTLAELPAGRSEIATHVVPAVERPRFLERAWERVREEVGAGRQAYVVCPRIGGDEPDEDELEDEPEENGGENGTGENAAGENAAGQDADRETGGAPRRPPLAVLDVAPALAEGPLRGLRVEILHGRLHPDEKDRVMTAFKDGEIDVLVSTTVVEVGVDVPNATVMAVLDADRFGVSQLHQLRGRVGRGAAPGLCLLVSEAPVDSPARERLDAVAATNDGFELARLDVEQRREGDVLGVAQSGRRSQLRLLSLLRDEELIVAARDEAAALVGTDPDLSAYPQLAAGVAALAAEERAEYLEKA